MTAPVALTARGATPADRTALTDLFREADQVIGQYRGGDLLRDRWSHVDLASAAVDILERPDLLVRVATIDGVPVGFGVARRERGSASIVGIYVTPQARGIGLGEAVLESIVEWAGQERLTGITADALPGDRDTKNFFETFGLVAHRLLVYRSIEADSAPKR